MELAIPNERKPQLNGRSSRRAKREDSDHRDLEIFLAAIHGAYEVDFRGYAYSSLMRRLHRCCLEEGVADLPGLRDLVLHSTQAMERVRLKLTVHVTAMFRDPGFYLAFRKEIVPALRTYPYLRFWVAGCSTGEEVYSLAILLHEEGIYPRCRIYATDVSPMVLERARSGIFPLGAMREYTGNYQKAGGNGAFAEYYTADSENAVFRSFLRDNIVFSTHNLAGDASFNEFHAIFCRNVMIYFGAELQDRVHQLFHESLINFGYLCLGRSETIRFTSCEDCYETISQKERIYRKIQ